jgi:hypothetical protein
LRNEFNSEQINPRHIAGVRGGKKRLEDMTMTANISSSGFWFDNPDAEITITDKTIQSKIKKIVMEASLGTSTKKYIVHDWILTGYAGADVCYIRRSKLRDLIVSINKKCSLNIDADASIIKAHIDKNTFILATTVKIVKGELNLHLNCLQVQREYACWKKIDDVQASVKDLDNVVKPLYSKLLPVTRKVRKFIIR